jgi:hypothetical protein
VEQLCPLVPQQVGVQPDILVAMDWTVFDHAGHSTLPLSLVTGCTAKPIDAEWYPCSVFLAL